MNDKTTISIAVCLIVLTVAISPTAFVVDVAKMAIAGLLGMASGQNWK